MYVCHSVIYGSNVSCIVQLNARNYSTLLLLSSSPYFICISNY